MIRVVVVDDHPAICAGLAALLRTEAGLAVVGVAHTGAHLESLLHRNRPAVVLLDQHLPDEEGLALCHRIKSTSPAPAVVVMSAFLTPSLSVAAMVAGADGVLDKAASAHSVCEEVRRAARGRGRPWPLDAQQARVAVDAVDATDVGLLRDLLRGLTPQEAMAAHGVSRAVYEPRVTRMLARIMAREP